MKSILRKFCIYLYYLPSTIRNKLIFSIHGVTYGKGLQTIGSIYVRSHGQINIGDNVRINSSPFANPIGGNERSYFQVLDAANLSIGNNTGISNVSITCSRSIVIGNFVKIGSGVCIFDTNFHSLNPILRTYRSSVFSNDIVSDPIIIDDYAFIGTRAIILKGAKIGKNSVVGAGSVVSGNIPANEIWAGNPARFIRVLNQSELSDN
jgi:acetyltransferase-like isoleucine patch superfamily enzyme